MNQHDAELPAIDGPWIEIRGGRTRYPRRPITGGRLLIGSGSNCHLQLGGGMPMAHSVVTRGLTGWTIEALVGEPALLVNGQPIRQAALSDGDTIQLGPFTLVAHLTAAVAEGLLAPLDIPDLLASDAATPAGQFAAALQNLSAEELVDRLTTELTGVLLAEQGAQRAAEVIEEAAADEPAGIDEEQVVAAVMAQLAEFTTQLSSRGSDLDSADSNVLPLVPRDSEERTSELLKKSA